MSVDDNSPEMPSVLEGIVLTMVHAFRQYIRT